jgi:hypothetical protein
VLVGCRIRTVASSEKGACGVSDNSETLDWREVFPRGVLDPYGLDGEPIFTPTDRRLLWHVEGALAVLATTPALRDLRLALYRYLCDTCEHHWRDYAAEAGGWRHPDTGEALDGIPAHRQCLWCSEVEWAGGKP